MVDAEDELPPPPLPDFWPAAVFAFDLDAVVLDVCEVVTDFAPLVLIGAIDAWSATIGAVLAPASTETTDEADGARAKLFMALPGAGGPTANEVLPTLVPLLDTPADDDAVAGTVEAVMFTGDAEEAS